MWGSYPSTSEKSSGNTQTMHAAFELLTGCRSSSSFAARHACTSVALHTWASMYSARHLSTPPAARTLGDTPRERDGHCRFDSAMLYTRKTQSGTLTFLASVEHAPPRPSVQRHTTGGARSSSGARSLLTYFRSFFRARPPRARPALRSGRAVQRHVPRQRGTAQFCRKSWFSFCCILITFRQASF